MVGNERFNCFSSNNLVFLRLNNVCLHDKHYSVDFPGWVELPLYRFGGTPPILNTAFQEPSDLLWIRPYI